ncbi:FtsX-like permease family protein [Gorillibacterium sp. sgz500922]|uniref:ABC transporter permease n=1 Tax=Gorillibacterium sp. sgz500922 TaxID=3446694 RepID=UPI003F67F64E
MALWTMILRKMANNKWLQLNLWAGLAVCVALFSSMPLYSQAILQRTLIREVQQTQLQNGIYPGFVRVSTTNASEVMDKKTAEAIAKADRYVEALPVRTGLDKLSFYRQRTTQRMKVYGADASERERLTQKTVGTLQALSDMEKRVKLLEGRMPVDRTDDVLEALVTQDFLFKVKRQLGAELTVEVPDQGSLRVMPVGVMATDPDADPYLSYRTEDNSDGLLIPFGQFEREFTQGGKARVASLEWRLALDYRQLKVGSIDSFIQADRGLRSYFLGKIGSSEVNIPAIKTIQSFQGKAAKLDLLLLSLYSPVMLLLGFYLYMAANLIVQRQKTDISVLRSRGASRLQIMSMYVLENLLLGLAALGVGPFLGIGFTKVLGAANGFLEFVDRSALEVSLTSGAYRIAALAVGGAILLTLIPALAATRASIVDQKRQTARLTKRSFWHKTGLDILLVGLSLYLLSNFHQRQEDLKRLALDSDALRIDPLLFLMPALFALGGGLLVLRLYPWLVRLLFWLGRRIWPPSLYHTLITVSRSSGQYLTLQVFLIMTVATGLFSANAARTINDNLDSQIRYSAGADIVLKTRWESDAKPSWSSGSGQPPQSDAGGGTASAAQRVQYKEPPFQPFQNLEGVEAVAQVFKKESARFSNVSGNKSGKTTLMGIDTQAFGNTAWMKNELLNYPINAYLNLIATNPRAVLISRSLADSAELKPGDPIRVSWDGLDETTFTVYGVIDYWPSWNSRSSGGGGGGEGDPSRLIVGHLSAIQNRLAVEPYEVWLKLKDGAAEQTVYDQLQKRQVKIAAFRDARQELLQSRSDPFRLAVNGILTLGFVISLSISFFGFLVFWILTLSGRTLSYGVLRAMGMPFRQIIGMMVGEQLLTSVAAVFMGAGIGRLVSRLFVPLFELSFATREQVLPFSIVRRLSDSLQLFGSVGCMLIAGLLILGYRLSRVRIAQALKLGEE